MTPFAGVDSIKLLQTGMRVAEFNQRLIANNVANVDTPNYNPVRLDFQAALRSALEGRDRFDLRGTQSRHLDARAERPELEGLALLSKNDYNKVDIDQELVSLSENTGRYTTYGSLLVKQFQMYRNTLNNLR